MATTLAVLAVRELHHLFQEQALFTVVVAVEALLILVDQHQPIITVVQVVAVEAVMVAAAMAVSSRGLKLGSPPKSWVATVISLASLEKRAPRLTSEAPLARLILDQ